MSTLLVLKFDSVGGAAQMRDRMLALQKQQLITVEDAAIMWRDTDGKPKLAQLNDMTGVGALGGAFWGMLFGLLFFIPLAGLALGAAMGAIAGSMSDVGIDDKFIKQVGESITPGTSALFLLTRNAVLDKVLEQTKDLKYEVLQTNLSQADEDMLRAAISASVGSAPAVSATMDTAPAGTAADSATIDSVSAHSAPADMNANTDAARAESMSADTTTADSARPDSVPTDIGPNADVATEETSTVEGVTADTAADTAAADNTAQS